MKIKNFKKTIAFTSSCILTSVISQTQTHAMIGRILRPIVTQGPNIVTSGGGGNV